MKLTITFKLEDLTHELLKQLNLHQQLGVYELASYTQNNALQKTVLRSLEETRAARNHWLQTANDHLQKNQTKLIIDITYQKAKELATSLDRLIAFHEHIKEKQLEANKKLAKQLIERMKKTSANYIKFIEAYWLAESMKQNF